MNHLVALSGGKDSTAMAIRLNELYPGKFKFFITPTGDELPFMEAHWNRVEKSLGQSLIRLTHPDFPDIWALIDHFKALPNFRQRWCTRILKIEVAQMFYYQMEPATVYVGLRADEQARAGNPNVLGEINQKYPLREWNWGLKEVLLYLKEKQITIPRRTDCGMCFYQRIGEWWMLWREFPELFQKYIDIEDKYGYTFMTPGKHKIWPHKLKDLSVEFWKGRMPREIKSGKRKENCIICSI